MTRCPCGPNGAGYRGRRAISAGAGSRSLVAMQLPGPPAPWTAAGADGRDAADQRNESLAVMEVGSRDADRQGQALAIDDEVDFRSLLTAVGRIRSRQLPPLRARTLTESIAHRDQSSPPRTSSSSRTRRWSLAHTRASVHSVNRRKAVIPDRPKPGGSWFHVQPEVATKMIAASTSRSPRRRCPPPYGRTGAGGTTRWNKAHRSSGAIRSTSASVIAPDCRKITPTEMVSKMACVAVAEDCVGRGMDSLAPDVCRKACHHIPGDSPVVCKVVTLARGGAGQGFQSVVLPVPAPACRDRRYGQGVADVDGELWRPVLPLLLLRSEGEACAQMRAAAFSDLGRGQFCPAQSTRSVDFMRLALNAAGAARASLSGSRARVHVGGRRGPS